MEKTLTIKYNGKTWKVKNGITFYELFTKIFKEEKLPMGVNVANRIRGMYQHLHADMEIKPVWYESPEGTAVYARSASLMLGKVLKDNFPEVSCRIAQSIQGQSYYIIPENDLIPENFFTVLTEKMEELVKEDIGFDHETVSIYEAIAYFEKQNMPLKIQLLKNYQEPSIRLNKCDDYLDYQIGPVAYKTGLIHTWEIMPFRAGFLLRLPEKPTHTQMPEFKIRSKYLEMYEAAQEFQENMGIYSIGKLNDLVLSNQAARIIHVSEAFQEKRVAKIAERIHDRKNDVKMVLISGPSSSGKTTFATRLGIQLAASGLNPVPLSLDNYFVDREVNPRDENGKYDFECLEALDLEKLNEDLNGLLNGKEIKTPYFDFTIGMRDEEKCKPLKLDRDDVLVIEGIHGLNPKLTPFIKEERKFKVYISAMTQLVMDETNRMKTTDTRLFRRIIRDNRYRGNTTSFTLSMWDNVRAGEKKHIFPFQEQADEMFNSALVYEHAVLKVYLEKYLLTVQPEDPHYLEAHRLYQGIVPFVPILTELVPTNSLLREFIGGSSFSYD